jgi:putative membrane protein
MMWGYGYNMMGWWWVIGAVVVIALVGAVVWAAVAASRRSAYPPPTSPGGAPNATESPRQVLDARYAKGELTTEEYQERIKNLGLGS